MAITAVMNIVRSLFLSDKILRNGAREALTWIPLVMMRATHERILTPEGLRGLATRVIHATTKVLIR